MIYLRLLATRSVLCCAVASRIREFISAKLPAAWRAKFLSRINASIVEYGALRCRSGRVRSACFLGGQTCPRGASGPGGIGNCIPKRSAQCGCSGPCRATNRLRASRLWVIGLALASCGLTSDAKRYVVAQDLAPDLRLRTRAMAILEKAERARSLALGEAPSAGGDTGCVDARLCELARDVAVALERADLIERAAAAHRKLCLHLLEAQVALAARTQNREMLEQIISTMDLKMAQGSATHLAITALEHGSLEYALEFFESMENVCGQTPDQDDAQGVAHRIFTGLLRAAPLAGPDPVLYVRALRFLNARPQVLSADDGKVLPSSAELAWVAAGRAGAPPRDGDLSFRARWQPRDFCTLYREMGRSFPAGRGVYAHPLIERSSGEFRRARLFLLAVAKEARARKNAVVQAHVVPAVAGALLAIGAVEDAHELVLECLARVGQGECSKGSVRRVLELLDHLEAAAAVGALQGSTLQAAADRAGACAHLPLRHTLLAAIASAMLCSPEPGQADALLHRLQEDIPQGEEGCPWYSTAEVARLCYRLVHQRCQNREESFRHALQLARTIPSSDDARALAMVALVEGYAQSGDIGQAAMMVEELVPLFRIPPGEWEWSEATGWPEDSVRAYYAACCNMIALEFARKGNHPEALAWFERAAQHVKANEDCELNDCAFLDAREEIIRGLLAAFRVTQDVLYAREALEMVYKFWRPTPPMWATWLAVIALVCKEVWNAEQALVFLRVESAFLVEDMLPGHDRVQVLLTLAEASAMLGAHSEARELIKRAQAAAKAHQAAMKKCEEQLIVLENEPKTLLPLVARTLAWQGETLKRPALLKQAAAILVGDQHADRCWDCGPLAVRIGAAAVDCKRPDLLVVDALPLAERNYPCRLQLGFGISEPALWEIMLLAGRSGNLAIIDTCEARADGEGEPYDRVALYTHLARGAFEGCGVLRPRQHALRSLSNARTWLEETAVEHRDGRFEYYLPRWP